MPDAVDRERLVSGAAALGVELDGSQAADLESFARLLKHWNRAFNLVSRGDMARLLPRHLLDSLSVAPLLPGGRIMDLGTGAGLPGVPLAIARRDLAFTLVDRSSRRIRFVARVIRELGLNNATACCADVRELPGEETFDAVVCRAVTDLDQAWNLAASRLREHGRLLVMYRGQARTDSGTAMSAPSGTRLMELRSVRIPGLSQEHGIAVLGRK